MKAVLFQSKDEKPETRDIQIPIPAKGDVLVELHYAALNHLDLWIWQEQVLDRPVISGSDGSGVIVAVGKDVQPSLIGREVIINPSLYWGESEKVYGANYQILGNPTNGTFAEYIAISAAYVYPKPAHLTLGEAAALPLAALTAYRALFTKARLSPKEKVLITGIGGGAALYLMQMAIAAGASVFVTSSSDDKIGRAITLGATAGFNYRNENWVAEAKAAARGFDVIVDSAGGSGFVSLTEVANPGARIVLFGRTAGNISNLKPGIIYNKQLQIMGTLMGSQKEFAAMLQFYEEHKLHPVIDKEFSLDQIGEAGTYLNSGSHFGKVILKIK